MNSKSATPVEVKLVASFFIKKASELNADNDLTNLKLQKILFYAQAEYHRKNGKLLFGEKIKAWKLGPVVVEVYDWLKGCGAYNITDFDVDLPKSKLSEDLDSFLTEIWQKYSKYSASYLVEKTHEKDSAWDRAQQNDDKIISEDLLNYVELVKDGW